MTSRTRTAVSSFLTVTLAIIVAPAFAEVPDGVSPGAVDRIAEIEGRCPSFFWGEIPDAIHYELVAYHLPEDSDRADLSAVEISDADQVVFTKVPGTASAWAPELAGCLTPGGEYVWFVRAVFREENGEVAEASEWSYGRYFSISAAPPGREVEEALDVLHRYMGRAGLGVAFEAKSTEPGASTQPEIPRQAGGRVSQSAEPKSVTTGKTAIKGTVPDPTGETYGVVGISNSANGAGLAAANTNGGPDLVLDGFSDGADADAIFSQAGIDRPAAVDKSFSLGNSGAGVLNLNVDGQITGDGSGLTSVTADDADTLDGQHGSYYQSASNLVSGTLSTSRYSAYSDLSSEGYLGNASGDIARNVGTLQSNLNADLLDGLHSTSFSASTHNHWNGSWSGAGRGLYMSSTDNEVLYAYTSASTQTHAIIGFQNYNSDTTMSAGVYGRGDSSKGFGVAGHNFFGGTGVGAWSHSGNLIEAYAGDYPSTNLRFYINQSGVAYADGGHATFKKIGETTESIEYGALSAISSPGHWFEDFGSGTLSQGEAQVTVETTFAKTVNLEANYKVFVTPISDEPVLLVVREKAAGGFVVSGTTLSGEPADCAFDYRIVARELGKENKRLEVFERPIPVAEKSIEEKRLAEEQP